MTSTDEGHDNRV